MIQFKAEFKYSKILVKTSSLGKIEIDCQKADPEKWSKIPELAFMFEDTKETPSKRAEINIEVHNIQEEEETKELPTNYKDILELAEAKGYDGKSKKKVDLIEFLNSL
jgi:hypothetical protein